MLQRVALRSEAQEDTGSRRKGTQLKGCCTNQPGELALAQTYEMFMTGAKRRSQDQQGKESEDAGHWTAVTRSTHSAFVQGKQSPYTTLEFLLYVAAGV